MHCAKLINNRVWLRCLKRNHQNFNVPQWWTIDLSTMLRKTTKIISFGGIWKYIKMLVFITRFISTYYAKTPLHELTYHKMFLSFCIYLFGVYSLTRISKNQLNSCNYPSVTVAVNSCTALSVCGSGPDNWFTKVCDLTENPCDVDQRGPLIKSVEPLQRDSDHSF